MKQERQASILMRMKLSKTKWLFKSKKKKMSWFFGAFICNHPNIVSIKHFLLVCPVQSRTGHVARMADYTPAGCTVSLAASYTALQCSAVHCTALHCTRLHCMCYIVLYIGSARRQEKEKKPDRQGHMVQGKLYHIFETRLYWFLRKFSHKK